MIQIEHVGVGAGVLLVGGGGGGGAAVVGGGAGDSDVAGGGGAAVVCAGGGGGLAGVVPGAGPSVCAGGCSSGVLWPPAADVPGCAGAAVVRGAVGRAAGAAADRVGAGFEEDEVWPAGSLSVGRAPRPHIIATKTMTARDDTATTASFLVPVASLSTEVT